MLFGFFLSMVGPCGSAAQWTPRLLAMQCCSRPTSRLDNRGAPTSLTRVTQLERLLRKALDGHGIPMRGRQLVRSDALMLFVEDVTWALMRPLVGTRHRILHAMQTPPFRVPSGLNKPMEVNSWLSFGCLDLRRCILAVIGTLLLPELYCGFLSAEQIEGRTFWSRLRAHHSSEDWNSLQDRAASWDPLLFSIVAFH